MSNMCEKYNFGVLPVNYFFNVTYLLLSLCDDYLVVSR